MKIIDVQIIPIKPRNGLVGFASVTTDTGLRLTSIGVHKRLHGSGYRITYPTKKIGDSNSHIFHPTTVETSSLIEQKIQEQAQNLFL